MTIKLKMSTYDITPVNELYIQFYIHTCTYDVQYLEKNSKPKNNTAEQ